MDTSQLFCPNEKCPDYRVRGKGNTVRNGRCGKQHTPKEKVVNTLQTLAERGSLRGTARVTGHKKDTIASGQKRAGEHAEALREYPLHDLDLDRVQVDELYTFVKKRRRTSEVTSRTMIPSERPWSGKP